MTYLDFLKKAHSKYKKDWCDARGYHLASFDEEEGINGECFACLDEFEKNEFQDKEYMRCILSHEEFVMWNNRWELHVIWLERRVRKWQTAQKVGKRWPCPECGEEMRPKLTHNCLSRRSDIYVCNKCGMLEALQDAQYAREKRITPYSFAHWYLAKPSLDLDEL